MDSDYKVLPMAVIVFKVLAWVALSLGVLSYVVILSTGGIWGVSRWTGVVALITGGLYFFFFMVTAECIKLLLEIKSKIK